MLGAVYWVFDWEFNRFPVSIVVVNESTSPIRKVEVGLAGKTWSVGEVGASATLRKDFRLRGSGSLYFTVFKQDGSKLSGTAANYLDSDCSGHRIGIRVGDKTAYGFDPR